MLILDNAELLVGTLVPNHGRPAWVALVINGFICVIYKFKVGILWAYLGVEHFEKEPARLVIGVSCLSNKKNLPGHNDPPSASRSF